MYDIPQEVDPSYDAGIVRLPAKLAFIESEPFLHHVERNIVFITVQ